MRFMTAIKFLTLGGALATGMAQAQEPIVPVLATSVKSPSTTARQITGQPMPLINDPRPTQDLLTPYQIQLDPPGAERLFRLESEDSLRERMRQEKRSLDQLERINFPSDVVLSIKNYDPQWRTKNWELHDRKVEPAYLTYDRLYFQEINSERYGWDLGAIQPFVSSAAFFFDFVMLPYHMASDPFRRYDSNSGYALPGDPIPYMWYPPNVSISGTVSEMLTIALLIAVFP